jgi:Transglycosylase-like domain
MLPRQPIEPARRNRGRSRRDGLAVLAVGATLALGVAGVALAATSPDASTGPDEPSADVPVLDHDSQFERSLGVGVARARYAKLYDEADRLDVAPKRDLSGTDAGEVALADGTDSLRKRIEAEKKRRKEAAEPDYGTPRSVGIEQSTLDAIAACESGGDPTAVDASGTYRGKYQFDMQTWASVGGSGDPAAAPEAEQDYRAALLMSRSGSSPWPVCG